MFYNTFTLHLILLSTFHVSYWLESHKDCGKARLFINTNQKETFAFINKTLSMQIINKFEYRDEITNLRADVKAKPSISITLSHPITKVTVVFFACTQNGKDWIVFIVHLLVYKLIRWTFFNGLVDWVQNSHLCTGCYWCLHHAFGHHSDGVLESLSFVAEPYSDDLAFIAELMCQSSDFSA